MSETARPSYLIIGASGGIGGAVARRLASEGARLVLAAREADRLRALADELGAEAHPVEATSFTAVEELVRAAGPLDGAVNLCGTILLRPAHQTSEADYHETIAANLTTSFALVRAMIAPLRQRGGSIVLLSSAAAGIGLSSHEAIAAAKAGVEGLVRSAAASYAPQGIRVNAVAPGLVDTPLASPVTGSPAVLKASTAMHPMRRIGAADEVARVVTWLLGPDTGWVTGQTWGVDGGLARVRSR